MKINKYFKKYYIYLVFFRIKNFLHYKFEKKPKSISPINIDDFMVFLWREVFKNLVICESGIYFRTKINYNKKLPVIVSQARLISLLCDGYYNEKFLIRSKYLILHLSDFLMMQRNKSNLFNFNKSKWDLQDEGIASVWAAIALVKSYEVTNDEKFLATAISTCKAMLKELYTNETSLVHTAGQNFWCLNAASKFGYLCKMILQYNYDDNIKNAMINSIRICIDNISEDGHFPYTQKHRSIYILLYHSSVMFYLEQCLDSAYIDKSMKMQIKGIIQKGEKYLTNRLDDSLCFDEPERKKYSHYVITAATSLAALKGKINSNTEKKVLKNITKYYHNDRFYLFIDDNGILYNSDLYKYKDVLLVETLYWLIQYFNKK